MILLHSYLRAAAAPLFLNFYFTQRASNSSSSSRQNTPAAAAYLFSYFLYTTNIRLAATIEILLLCNKHFYCTLL